MPGAEVLSLARHVLITRGSGVEIDGQVFPWFLADEVMRIKVDRDTTRVFTSRCW